MGGVVDIFLTTGQVANALHCSLRSVHNIPVSELPFVRVGNRRRYLLADVEQYADRRRVKASRETPT